MESVKVPNWSGYVDPGDNTKSFEANGTTYYIESTFNTARWIEWCAYEEEFALGMSFKDHMSILREAFDAAENLKLATTVIKLHDLIQGLVHKKKRRIPTALKMCCLFINYEGEDVGAPINEAMFSKKLEDWSKEKIDVNFFFRVIARSLPGLKESYKEIFPDILGIQTIHLDRERKDESQGKEAPSS